MRNLHAQVNLNYAMRATHIANFEMRELAGGFIPRASEG